MVLFDGEDSWETVLRLACTHLDAGGLERLKSVLDPKCRCVVIERHYLDKDYRDTFSHFHSKRFGTPDSRCVRLHFFSNPITEEALISGDQHVKEAYQGYSVIRPTKPHCIGRTLLSHRLRLESRAHLSICREWVHIMGTQFAVEGFPFISQDVDATVCAQSALWMLLRYYSNKYPIYSEILPFQITNLANSHAAGNRVYPSAGLYSWQLAEALRLQKFAPVVYGKKRYNEETFYHLLYTYLESGLPMLITVPEHVLVGFGHISNYLTPYPQSPPKFLYSSHFNRALVINDDGRFPYQTLAKTIHSGTGPVSRHDWDAIEEFIVPLPEKVFLTAEQAQTVIQDFLQQEPFALSSSERLSKGGLVMRLYLTSARAFKRTLHQRKMGHEIVESIYRILPMPHFIWICEIADYDEYASERKILGEVIWDATCNALEPDGWITCHFPETLRVNIGSALNEAPRREMYSLDASDSYLLFDSNLHSLSHG